MRKYHFCKLYCIIIHIIQFIRSENNSVHITIERSYALKNIEDWPLGSVRWSSFAETHEFQRLRVYLFGVGSLKQFATENDDWMLGL